MSPEEKKALANKLIARKMRPYVNMSGVRGYWYGYKSGFKRPVVFASHAIIPIDNRDGYEMMEVPYRG